MYEELVKRMRQQHQDMDCGNCNTCVILKAADVVEVRHGRWIKDDSTGEPICSICHSGKPTRAVCSSVIEHKLKNYEIRYCYYCGARMDGGQDK